MTSFSKMWCYIADGNIYSNSLEERVTLHWSMQLIKTIRSHAPLVLESPHSQAASMPKTVPMVWLEKAFSLCGQSAASWTCNKLLAPT